MNKLILLLFLITFSCSSTPDMDGPEIIPTASLDGCKTYSNNRIQYQNCVTGLRKLWAERESAQVKLEVVEEKRYNETWVIKKYQHCRHDFCDTFEIAVKDETVWGQIKNNSWFTLIGMVVGYGLGL